MIFTVPLQSGTTLANVRYIWIANGVAGSALSAGITQPSVTFPLFRISATPPTGAEEIVVYDSTDNGNWNPGGYRVALSSDSLVAGVAANVTKINGVTVAGAGTSGDLWRGA